MLQHTKCTTLSHLPQILRPHLNLFICPLLSFREPNKNIKLLRHLALQGREETLREEAEGREKAVQGSVDSQVRREVGGGDGMNNVLVLRWVVGHYRVETIEEHLMH